jgi:outer membrane beta-barrel protein
MKTNPTFQAALASALLALVLVAGPVRAEDAKSDDTAAAKSDDDAKADDAKADDAKTDDTKSDKAADVKAGDDKDAKAADSKPAAAPENVETIYAVQGKPYLMAGKFEIAPQLVQSVNDEFTSHSGIIVSGIYHLKENVALELSGGAFFWWDDPSSKNPPRLGGRDTDLTQEILDKERLKPERVKLYQYTWLLTGDLQWSPLYGKVNLQDLVLGQFNLYLSVGAGAMGIQLEKLTQTGQGPKQYETLPGPFNALPAMQLVTTFGGGLRFYFTDWLGIRFEVRDYVAPLAVLHDQVTSESTSSFDVNNTLLAQLGVSFIF